MDLQQEEIVGIKILLLQKQNYILNNHGIC
nr:MAG TPA: hypothetical protein [Caudoviricetes sp.]